MYNHRGWGRVVPCHCELRSGVAVVGVTALILIVSLFSSRKHLAATKEKQIQKAGGEAARGKVKADAAHFELKIGKTRLRLLTQEQLDAFQMGESYRVHFLPGPTPTVLSAEALGTEAEAEQTLEPETPLEDDLVLQRHRKGRPVAAVLAVLTLGIPLAGFAVSYLPGPLRFLGMLALLGVGFGFVSWAFRRMSDCAPVGWGGGDLDKSLRGGTQSVTTKQSSFSSSRLLHRSAVPNDIRRV